MQFDGGGNVVNYFNSLVFFSRPILTWFASLFSGKKFPFQLMEQIRKPTLGGAMIGAIMRGKISKI